MTTPRWDGRATLEWGGETRPFRLGFGELVALEAETGLGYLELWEALALGKAKLAHVIAVLRYGLEGAGVAPQEAVRLVERYGRVPPFAEAAKVAKAVYGTAMWLPAELAEPGKEAGGGTRETAASPSPGSTGTPS